MSDFGRGRSARPAGGALGAAIAGRSAPDGWPTYVARQAVYVIFTEHDGEHFQLSDRVLPSWSEGEDPLAVRARPKRRPRARPAARAHRKKR